MTRIITPAIFLSASIAAPRPQYEEDRLDSSREMTIDGVRTNCSAASYVEKLPTADPVFLPLE